MATVRWYRSSDGGAPGLTAVTGSMIAVLDAVLVNGFNSGTTTMSQSGGTVTATRGGHGFSQYQRVLVSGATPTDYNGEFTITSVPDSSTFTYTISNVSAASPATGTITTKYAPLGWSIGFTGTNLRAYQCGAGSNGRWLRLDDGIGSGASPPYSAFRGYGAMTSVNVGTDPFPTVSQLSGGLFVHKHVTSPTNVIIPWFIVGNENFVYIQAYAGTTSTSSILATIVQSDTLAFGDFISYKPNDVWNTIIIGNNGVGTGSADTDYFAFLSPITTNANLAGHYIIRNALGMVGAVPCTKWTASGTTNFGTTTSVVQYPNPCNNSIELDECYIGEKLTGFFRRGKLPGIWDSSLLSTWANVGDVYLGSSPQLSGKVFFHSAGFWANSPAGLTKTWEWEVSNTWATS